MKKTNETFDSQVVRGKDFDSLDLVYTENARILTPGAEMVGERAEIKAFGRGAIEALGVTGAKLETVSAEACGEQVLEIGPAHLALANGSSMTAKYVVYWKKGHGSWKWPVDIWNLNGYSGIVHPNP